jgi:hypothetical protein
LNRDILTRPLSLLISNFSMTKKELFKNVEKK